MNKNLPRPGNGYLIREYLGGGAMKEAYRATSPVGFRDVAILRYIQRSDEGEMGRDFNVLLKLRGTPYAEYLGYPELFFSGDDGDLYFAEELLARPLDSLSPMRNGALWLQIARDLCRGLQCLHAAGLKHSDLKLDNCGVDNQGRAKIFDLSSVSSEPGDDIRGAVLTRAPEYFRSNEKYNLPGDIWALGATLFALRTGDYPFVPRDEIKERVALGKLARSTNAAERSEAEKKKAEVDERIRNRALATSSETDLHVRVDRTLPGNSGEFLFKMLSFNQNMRPTAQQCASNWASMVAAPVLADIRQPLQCEDYVSRLKSYLAKILDDYVTVTDRQWDRLVENYEQLRKEVDRPIDLAEVTKMIQSVKQKRQSQTAVS